jgi:thymidylate kinase
MGRAEVFLVQCPAWRISTCYFLVAYEEAAARCSQLLQQSFVASEAERIEEEDNVVEMAAALCEEDQTSAAVVDARDSLGRHVRSSDQRIRCVGSEVRCEW